ncbi:RNA 3'-phosphate cyclase [Candidatus Woesearchaeota archaeon]|nr:RNA 3'-phosphate cyclase [Candidatus Woesearchaeota archaeon]|tara:strand:- start:8926 stop:10011 length:1086 start_codon:yes stop_codon:yes gene_type:complete
MAIKLSGEHGEGGGSIVRVALALSTITGKAFEVDNIRKGRPKPGLKAQHLYCIKALQALCSAEVEGASLGSSYLKYNPGKISAKTIKVDIGTAGSIALLLQSVLPPCLFADGNIKLEITGGTSGKWAAPFDYFNNVFVPIIKGFCEKIDVKLIRRGYYPKGQGKIELKIKPEYKLSDFSDFNELYSHLKQKDPLNINLIEQGELVKIEGISHASLSLEMADVAERQARTAKLELTKLGCPVNIQAEYCDTASIGSGITLWAAFSKDYEQARLGADALGEPGKKAEVVGEEAAKKLIKEIESKAPVDKHLADQILLFMAFTKNSKIKVSELTNHCRTNIYVIEEFLGKVFKVDEEEKIISLV